VGKRKVQTWSRQRKGLASSGVYFTITSALSSWKSLSERRTISPWLIQTYHDFIECQHVSFLSVIKTEQRHTFFLIFPRIWANRFSPSKHWASIRPLPNIFNTWAYSVIWLQDAAVSQGKSSVKWKRREGVTDLVRPPWRPIHASHRRSRSSLFSCSFHPVIIV
jgi:hypothetical protein